MYFSVLKQGQLEATGIENLGQISDC